MKEQSVKFKKQKLFPYIEEYREQFPITKDTIFVYKNTIFSNKTEKDWLEYYDILHHELEHLRSQNEIGADIWIHKYLSSDEFRLEEELRAYKYQLEKVKEMGDKTELMNITTECIANISSPLYGNIISYKQAEKLLTLNK